MSIEDTEETKNEKNNYGKWCVLVIYILLSVALTMAELMFAAIPKQTAAYYGIKGKYYEVCI